MTIGFTNKAVGHLMAAILTGDTQITVIAGEYSQFFESPADVYVMLRGPVYRELVKVDISASVQGSYLTIVRGQGGTAARAWPRGTLMFATTHEDHYNAIIQAGEQRTIDYNPNGILSPLYAGEKIYQSGPSGCERWWRSFDAVNPYWDLITGAPCGEEVYLDIGWTYNILMPGPNWESQFDNTHWEQNVAEPYGVWNAGQQSWDSEYKATPSPMYWVSLTPIGGWNVDYSPDAFRITTPYTSNFSVYIWNGTHYGNMGAKSSEETITITNWVATYGWVTGIRILFATTYDDRYLTDIEFRIP